MRIPAVAPGSIVVAYDGSEHAERALRWAADRAVLERRALDVVHAVCADDPDLAADRTGSARSCVDAAVAEVGSRHHGLVVRGHVGEADARATFVALSEDAHLIVVGSHPRGPLRLLPSGSVRVVVGRRAACPVVVVCPEGATVLPVGACAEVDAEAYRADLADLV